MTDQTDRLLGHIRALYPILRSVTGPGLRQTLRYIGEHTGAISHEVPSGTPVLDWVVPQEWTVNGARISRLSGETIIDITDHTLHLVQYSVPFSGIVPRAELERHLHSLPAQPELIPYRTGYYAEDWGFCLTQRQREAMTDDAYRVEVDTVLAPGSLSYAELLLEGEVADEMLLSVHCCHPSLANDNLSSIAVAIELVRQLTSQRRHYSYRLLFIPGTIGSITWLAQNPDAVARIRHGLVLSCLGDPGPPTYKSSRRGNAPIDRYVAHVLAARGLVGRSRPFTPYGYDERQYCSPGFNLPVGCLMRSANGTFPEYHTSADNLDFVQPTALADSLALLSDIVDVLEKDCLPLNLSPYGEPQLGRRGLYAAIGGQPEQTGTGQHFDQMTLLWLLNLSDGSHTLLDIAERAEKPFAAVVAGAAALQAAGLLAQQPLAPCAPLTHCAALS